ncbi:hypothetical protein [Acidianus hospitalis]|nr:hypothetical protein [Acidianus hospitalis]
MSDKINKFEIGIIFLVISIIAMEAALPLLSLATPVSVIPNFNTPILKPCQARYTQPWVGKITFVYTYTSPTAEFEALIQGKVDTAGISEKSEYTCASCKYKNCVYVGIAPVRSFGQIVFSFNSSYITSYRCFRYAVSSLICPTNITDYVWCDGLLGQDIPYFVSPKVYAPWFNPEVVTWYEEHESYNITRAVICLSKVPGVTHVNCKWYYHGKPLVLTFLYCEDSPCQQRLAQYLKSQFALINITLCTEATTFATQIGAATTPPFVFNMTTFGWINLCPAVSSWFVIYTTPCDTGGFYNATITNLIHEADSAPTVAEDINLTKQAELDLQYCLPYIIINWANAVQGVWLPGWANYLYLCKGTQNIAIQYCYVHPVNETLTGDFIVSNLCSSLMRHLNLYSSASFYAYQIFGQLYESPAEYPFDNLTDINPADLVPLLASKWCIQKPVTETLPNGKELVNGTVLTVYFVKNATFINGYPVTACDYNFTIWYLDIPGMLGTNTFCGLTINYTYLKCHGEINGDYFGTITCLVYSQVVCPYEIKIYLNDTESVVPVDDILTDPVLYEYQCYNHIKPCNIYNCKFTPLISYGPYIWDGSSASFTNKCFTIIYNPHYFRICPLIFLNTTKEGTPYTYTATFYCYTWCSSNDSLVPHPVVGSATAWLVALDVPGVKYGPYTTPIPMTMKAPGVYTVTFNTTGLPAGVYEIVAKVTWGNGKEEFDYGSLNITPVPVTTTVPPTTTTHVSTTPVALYIGIGIVIIVIIAAIAFVIIRRR